MSTFSKRSLEKLMTCHPDLETIFNHAVSIFDCSILIGERTEEEQDSAYRDGLSQLKYPESRHNTSPSMAIDVAPYPIDWKNIRRFYYFAGYVMSLAKQLKVMGLISHDLRWGGDWDQDTEVTDNKFNDLVHFELIV